jgi:hypothetical protein
MVRASRMPTIAARCAVLCAAGLLCGAAGQGASPREQVEARRTINPNVVVDVITGERLTGSIERTTETDFYLADKSGLDRVLVPYFAVRQLTDPATGERIPFDPPAEAPAKSAPPDRPPDARPAAPAETALPPIAEGRSPLVVWIAGGAVAVGLLAWVVVSRFKRP